jgi:DNA-binding response OmpR family regulator
MDNRKHEVTRGGKVIHLTPKEYKLLNVLLSNSGEAINRRKLIDNAWGPDFKEGNNELNVHIKYLRTKIDSGSNKPLIHTIRGVGFVLKE